MTAKELLVIAREGRPNVHYKANKKGTVIGAFSEVHNRYVVVAALLITGRWVSVPMEVLVNGKPMVSSEDFDHEEA